MRVCQRTGPRGRRHVRSRRHRHGRRPVGSRRHPVVPRSGPRGRRHRAIIATRSRPPPRRIAPPSRRRGGRVTTARSCHGGEAAVRPTLSRETASPLPNWARCRWSPYHYYNFNLLNVVFQKRLAVAYWRRSAFVLFSPPTVVVNNI